MKTTLNTRPWRAALLAGAIGLCASAHAAPATAAAGRLARAADVTLLSTVPAAGASGVCTTAPISATFSVPSGREMNASSISMGSPSLDSAVVLDFDTGKTATFTPSSPLKAGVTYVVTVKGGETGVRDLAQPPNTMRVDASWTFTAIDCAVPAPLAAAGL